MYFAYIAPSAGLQEFVRDYLIAHFVFDRDEPRPVKPYAAKPEQGITFFVRGLPTTVNLRTGEACTAAPVSVFRQQVSRCDVHLPAEFLMFRVHLQPGALFRLLDVPLDELGEDYLDAEPILGSGVRAVSEELAAARNHDAMVTGVERYLLRAVRRARHDVHAVDIAARRLAGTPLAHGLDEVAREAGLSPRHLHRSFSQRIGVGPKLYSRLARFQRAGLLKSAFPAMSWPRVAIELGYSDYQHMVRDFRQFTDATPPAWLRAEAGSPEYVLDRPNAGSHARSGSG